MKLSAPCYSATDHWEYFAIDYSGKSVLDVGSSVGSFQNRWFSSARKAATAAKRYVTVDHELKAKLTIVSDAHKLPFQSESFDIVIANNVIEHLRIPELAGAEMHRVS